MASGNKGVVGIIGLGIMGGAFAENLVAAGWRVIGYDIAPARRKALARAGVEIAADAVDVARQAKTVITSLPKPEALAATAAAIAKAGLPRRVIVEASTFTIDDKTRAQAVLHKAGHLLLDCPVSGTGAQAKLKDLVVYASGGAAEIKRLRPMFAAFGRGVFDLGDFGNGSRMKYVANLLVAIHNVASAEAMVLGIKAGLAATDLRSDQDRRRQFTNLRAACADDGEGSLRQSDHENLGVAKGHGRDRPLRAQDQSADADVRCLEQDL